MVKPVSLSRLACSLTCLTLLLGGTVASAQQVKPTDDKRTESEEAVFIPIEYRPPPWQVSVGVRLSGKAKVKFSGLGAIPTSNYAGPNPNATDKTTDSYKAALAYVATYGRVYNDGTVSPDSTYTLNTSSPTETAAYTQVTPTDGKTNVWNFTSADQVVTHNGAQTIAMHNYSVDSAGATADADNGQSPGWDIEISRELGASKRMSWGLVFGMGLNDINCKTSDTINAKLHTTTDYYSLNGITLPSDLSSGASSTANYQYFPYTTITNEAGETEYVYLRNPDGSYNKSWLYINQQRLSTDPVDREEKSADTADIVVQGYWQVKGAYMTARFGPYFTYQLTRRLALRASAGVTFTVLGAKFLLNERAYIPVLEDYMQLTNEKVNLDPLVTGSIGYFFSGELDAFMTDRTGFYIGLSHESYGRDIDMWYYSQQASISLSTGNVLRTGVTTRF